MTSIPPPIPSLQTALRPVLEPPPAVAPFEEREIRAAALRPHRVIDLVLVERARLAKTVAGSANLASLIGVLLLSSVVSALPYGFVLGPQRALRVAALNVGAVAICVPALHVFICYFGLRIRPAQTAIMALLVSAVASMFALGFAPVAWFIELTTPPGSTATSRVSAWLLTLSVLAGVVHFARAASDGALALQRVHRLLLVAWVGLLLFVVHRLGAFLELM